jgi:hypothetical protein
MLLGGPAGKALATVVEGVTRIRKKAKESGSITLDDLLAELKTAQEKDPAIHALIKSLAHKAEARLAGKL